MYLQRLILRIAWYPTETFQSSYYMYLYPDFEIQMTLYLFKLVIILFLHLLMNKRKYTTGSNERAYGRQWNESNETRLIRI